MRVVQVKSGSGNSVMTVSKEKSGEGYRVNTMDKWTEDRVSIYLTREEMVQLVRALAEELEG